MKRFRKILALVLMASMLLTILPVQALAAGMAADTEDDEQLRQVLRETVSEAVYSNGLFEFLTTRMNTSEDLSFVEIAVVRKGGTAGEASVTLKAIDVTAKYGEDYTLSVPAGIFDKTLPENENAKPLIESLANSDQAVTAEDDPSSGTPDESVTPEESGMLENSNTPEESSVAEAVYAQDDAQNSPGEETYITLPGTDKERGEEGGLRAARDAALGQTSNRKNWREVDETEKDEALDLHKELYEGLEGVSYTFHFADGEYIKKIRFNTIDDKISEDEEQVLFALTDARGGVTGESLNAFMNIEDNEEKELVRFEMGESEVRADPPTGYAEVTVKRTAGLYRYGSVSVSTAAVSAVPDVDYEPIVTELRFVPGQKSQKVQVPLLGESPEEGLQFYVRLDPESPNLSEDGPTQTLVTIKAAAKTRLSDSAGAARSLSAPSDADALSVGAANVGLLSSEGYEADNNGWWYKTKTLTPDDITDGRNYGVTRGSTTCSYIPISQKNTRNWIYYRADLSMVEKIRINWANTSSGTRYGDSYNTNFYSNVYFGSLLNRIALERQGKFGSTLDWINLNDSDRQQQYIYCATQTFGDCYDSALNVGDITLFYKPIKVTLKLNTEDPDARVVPKTWTTPTTSTNGTSQLVGGLSFAGDTSNLTSQTYFDGDTVYLAPKFDPASPDTSKVYLWGYKIERIGTNGYYYVKGTTLNIRDVYMGNMSDSITGELIPRGQIMMSGGTEIALHPVYKQKNAFVRINFDSTKGGMEHNCFENGNVLKVGMLDTIHFNAYARTGYSVSGYRHGNINFYEREVSSVPDEWYLESLNTETGGAVLADYLRALDGATGTIDYSLTHAWFVRPVSGIRINPATPGILDFSPEKSFTDLTVQYSYPYLKAKVDPQSGDQDKGSIFYHPEEAEDEDDLLIGDSRTPLIISPIERGKAYNLTGVPDDGYRVVWKNWTGDINEDGIISREEAAAISDYANLFERKAINGSIYSYRANYDRPLIYYSFERKPTQGSPGLVHGQVVLKGGTVLQNSGDGTANQNVSIPVRGAQVIINGHQTATDDEGNFSLRDKDFTTNEYHSLIVHYKDRDYIGYIDVNAWETIGIDAYDDFVPYNFKGYEIVRATVAGETQETYKALGNLKAIENKDADMAFQFDVKSNQPGLSAGSAKIRFYTKDGALKMTEPITVTPQNGLFTFTLNPAALGIVPGDTITLQIFDQDGKPGLEHPVGLGFIKNLDSFSLLTSFRSPASGFIDTVGAIDTAFDLGLAGKADQYMQKGDEEWVIAFGFNKDWEKSLLDGSGKKEELKDAAKSADANKTKDTTTKAVDQGNNEKKGASLTADMKFGVSTSLYLRMTVNKDPTSEYYGYAYFNEMIISAKVSGGFSTKVEIQTPVGVTVFVGLDLSGDVTAMMVVEKYQDHYKYFDANGEIDFSRADDDDPNRDFTIYGKFMVNPSIKITVGAKIPLAEVSISGQADFNMNFTTLGAGSGAVTLTSELALTVACFEFKWQVANQTYDLFSYSRMSRLSAGGLLGGDSYLYDSAAEASPLSRDYLENRGTWQGGGGRLLRAMAAGSGALNEQMLLQGVYPYPYTLLSDLGNGRQLLVFLDDDGSQDDRNRTQLYYSIYDNSEWSRPEKVDDDDTPDGIPCVYDVGDRVLVAWSSTYDMIGEEDDVLTALNKNNIKARFFDKDDLTFGPVQEVTRQTETDTYSDSYPYVAYWKDGEHDEEHLMIVYTKSDYSASDPAEGAVVGDVLNPYTTLAYRFYDFEHDCWLESGGAPNYYGQSFLDASRYAQVDESEILISEDDDYAQAGCWTRVPTEGEISIQELGDPLIVDSDAIGYEGYAVIAYTIDDDGITSTTQDRELFIQLYDFENNVFFPPIRYTGAGEGLCNLVFDQNNDNVYLYYLSAGDIRSIDIGYLVNQNLLYYEDVDDEGTDVFVVNKLAGLYRGPETVVRHPYDIGFDADGNKVRQNERPIDEFMVESDENNVYLVWGESGVTYRDGIDPHSEEAALPENYFREHQIYAARQTIGTEQETPLYEEDGVTPATYPSLDENGVPIDYSTTPDINNDVGVVQAGDPIIRKYRPTEWSEPVKLTDEQGANFNDLDFVTLPDGSLRVVFVKGRSTVQRVAGGDGKDMSVEDVNNRMLMTADFDIHTRKAEVEIEPMDAPGPGELMPVSVNLKNLALTPLEDAEVELLQIKDDQSETVVATQGGITLKGGAEAKLNFSWQAPEDPSGISLRAVVRADGEVLCSAEIAVKAASAVDVTDVETQFVDRDQIYIRGTAINNGNLAASAAVVHAKANGAEIGSLSLGAMAVGERRPFEFYGNLNGVQFESTRNADGSATDKIPLSVYSDGTGQSVTCERSASAEEMALMDNVSNFSLQVGGRTISDSISLERGNSAVIAPVLAYEDEDLPTPRVVYVSGNEAVADFGGDQMTLRAESAGSTTVTAYVLPPKSTMTLSQDGPAWEENLNTLPDEAVLVQSFTVSVTEPASHNGGSHGTPSPGLAPQSSTPAQRVTATTVATVTNGNDGITTASVNAGQMRSAVSDALKQAGSQAGRTPVELQVRVEAPHDANGIETEIPQAALSAARKDGVTALTLSTTLGTIAFNEDAFSTLCSQAGEDLKLTISRVELAALTEALRQTVGDRPVLDFSVTSGGKIISQFAGDVTVSVPYSPAEGEDLNAIVVYYIGDDNTFKTVTTGRYDATTGRVVFVTDHFSRYAVGYNKVSFSDVKAGDWYYNAVSFLAARGITMGVGGGFDPGGKLTRGQFITLLLRAYGIEPDENPVDNFADAGDTYYTGYLAAAKRLSIADGVGDNRFAPESDITRQEMFKLLYTALKIFGKVPEGSSGRTLADFSDSGEIANWAKESMTALVEAGSISGSGGRLHPTGTTTRAEMAQVLYNLINN